MAEWWFHDSVRKVTVAFMKTLNDVHVRRFKSDGSLARDIKVPLSFDMKSKMTSWISYKTASSRGLQNILPRMSVEMTGMTYAPDRAIQPFNKIAPQGSVADGSMNFVFAPVPWNIQYRLSIWSKLMTDAMQILEQVCSNFSPSLSVTVTEIPELNVKRDIDIILESVSPAGQIGELGEEDDRTIVYDLDFTAQAYIYPPTRTGKVIETIVTSIDAGSPPELLSVTETTEEVTS